MKWFYNKKISVKLNISFLIIVLLSAVIGIFGIVSLNSVQKNGESLYKNNTVHISEVGQMQRDFLRIRIDLRQMLLVDNEKRPQYDKNAKNLFTSIENRLNTYGKTLHSDSEKAEFKVLQSLLLGKYKDILNTITTLALENKDTEALNLLTGEGDTLGKSTDDSFKKLDNMNLKQAEDISIKDSASATRSICLMIGILVFILVIAIILSSFISRIISNPINKLLKAANDISEGNLNVILDIDTKEEVGGLSKAFEKIITSLKNLVSDANILEKAALEGNLSIRADASKHTGEYKNIIEGVNKTLDEVIEPINEATSVLDEMSKGNLQVYMQGDYKGYFSEVKNTLNSTINALSSYIRDISGVLNEMSNSNLDLEITNEYKGDFLQIKDSLNLIIKSFNEIFGKINTTADQVSSGSNQVSDGSQALSQGTTEQASAIEELTSSISEVAAQTKQNAVNAAQANELTLKAKEEATQGNIHMKEMLESMDELNECSSNISKIIKVIDDIAFQTNILALNAAVEAARAGQHGKGFAVVAEEVRNLAARSANAAKETTSLIEGSIKKVESGTKIANNTAESLNEIVVGVAKAATLVGDISNASNEQATAISEINKGIEQVSDVVQTNSSTAEESAASSEELSSQALLLKNMVSQFKLSKSSLNSFSVMDINTDKQFNVLSEVSTEKSKPKISLSDTEFGKY